MSHPMYFDHNATTPLHPEVLDAMLPYLRSSYGNPSSAHQLGRQARSAIEQARQEVAELLNCETEEVFFTSCATESNNMAIKGVAAALRNRGKHVITTTVEHPSVLIPCIYLENSGYRVTCLDVDNQGLIDPEALKASLTEETILVSVMYANNETGTIFPVEEMAAIAMERGVTFHCDAVQAVGKIPLDWKRLQTNLLSFSGHKLNAPKGIGALIVRRGTRVHPLLHGGSQEKKPPFRHGKCGRNCCSGESVPHRPKDDGIRTFPSACASATLGAGILSSIPMVRLNGNTALRLANTSHFSFPHIEPDALVRELDKLEIAVSSGSACSSGALKNSPVLTAMGLSPDSSVSHLRVSLGRIIAMKTSTGYLPYSLAWLKN